MTHFGIICPTASGHLNPMTTLGYELKKRGNRVTLFGFHDAESKTLAAGLDFWAIGETDYPPGTTAKLFTELGKLSGFAALKYTVNWIGKAAEIILREAPAALKEAGVEALLVDQVSQSGGTIAEFMNIPFITVCSAMMLHREDSIPPFNTPWNYNPGWWGQLRNRAGYNLIDRVTKPIQKLVADYRREWKLPLHSNYNSSYSQLAQISQQPAELEFPRQNLPEWFHFTGPYHNPSSREPAPFPWEKLTGEPLIYASMGTLQNRLIGVFQTIAESCVGLDAQLVISLGGSAEPDSLPNLPGSPLVVKYAPQLELLQKATLTITHAGLNTTLESLSNGVPMVGIPVANDQPGVATRIAWSGVGEVVRLNRLSVPRLRNAIARVLKEKSYKNNAIRLQEAIRRAGGVSRAADIIEQAVATGKPVLAQS